MQNKSVHVVNCHLPLLNMFLKYHFKLKIRHFLYIFLILFLFSIDNTENNVVNAQAIVKTLPGYNGTLPFNLETGYVSVGEVDDVELFYYFIESERDPEEDSLVVWLSGGPGCSGLNGLVFEVGPWIFDLQARDGSVPTIIQNPYSWTKVANIIFLDLPVGAGFSYSTTSKGYYSSDSKSSINAYEFLQKWLLNHSRFIKNRLYIAGDSYAGKLVPIIATEISKGNERDPRVQINLQGYVLGNPLTNINEDLNARVSYANQMGLISDDHFKLAKDNCNGEYVDIDPKNNECLYALQLINECMRDIRTEHILEPSCLSKSKDGENKGKGLQEKVPSETEKSWCPVKTEDDLDPTCISTTLDEILEETSSALFPSERENSWCHDDNYEPIYQWADSSMVQEALQIRKETKEKWTRCNYSLVFDQDITNVVPYHQFLSKRNYSALVFSGDHDYEIPYTGTLKWIRNLSLTLKDRWRPWYVDSQVAGYTENYGENGFHLTFATIKGAGHTASEYKPRECLVMIHKWLSGHPL